MPAALIRRTNRVAPLPIAVAHELGGVIAETQRREGALLADARGAQHGILVHLHHRFDQRRRSRAGIAEPESRHGKSLGKTVQ